MIKDRNIDDAAAIQPHKLMGAGLGPVTGEILYVGTSGTNAYNWLRSRVTESKLFTSLDTAIGSCVANRGDVILLSPGHVETIASAGAIAVDVAGVQILGLGSGADRPTFTFSAVDSTITISAASVTFKNFIVKPSIDSVVSPIVVSGANCTLDFETQDASALIECVRALLTTAAADNLDLNLVYKGFIAGNACVNAVRLVGCDNAKVNVDFYGVASVGIVEFHTTACHNIDISGTFYNSGTTNLSKNVVDTITLSTWSVDGFDATAGAEFSGGSGNAIAVGDLSAIASEVSAILVDTGTTLDAALAVVDGYFDAPTADADTDTTIRDAIGRKTDASVYVPGTTKSLAAYNKGQADLQEKTVLKAAATMVNAQVLFTIAGGSILVEGLVSECVTGNDATASTLQYSATPTVGAATTISGATTTLASVAAGYSISILGTALSSVPTLSVGGPNLGMTSPLVVPEGTITVVIGVGSTTGTWKHYLRYRPLAVGVTVV